jgi:hypothetical protein
MTRRQPVPARLIALPTAVALALGGWLLHDGARTQRPPQPSAADTAIDGSDLPEPDGPSAGSVPGLPSAPPVRISIPALGVHAPLVPVGRDRQGRIAVPPESEPRLAGWYRRGVTPGSAGTAIIDGHVDTRSGPAVFYGLGGLRRGDTIEVDRRDHRAAVFVIYAMALYRKHGFPARVIYGPRGGAAELRVITCGGAFNPRQGYLDDVVVFARLARVSAA